MCYKWFQYCHLSLYFKSNNLSILLKTNLFEFHQVKIILSKELFLRDIFVYKEDMSDAHINYMLLPELQPKEKSKNQSNNINKIRIDKNNYWGQRISAYSFFVFLYQLLSYQLYCCNLYQNNEYINLDIILSINCFLLNQYDFKILVVFSMYHFNFLYALY